MADTRDRRRVAVEITPAGEELLARIGVELVEREKAWTSAVDAPLREQLVRGLGRLQAHLRDLPPEP